MGIFVGAVDIEGRHITSHPEYEKAALLRDLLELESMAGRMWVGNRAECPEVLALRFFLCALGKEEGGRLVAEIRRDNGRRYERLDEVQMERLERYF